MPNFNQTGPDGEGPKTGRCLGKCRTGGALTNQDSGKNRNPEDNVGQGQRQGAGLGQRRGMGPGGGKGRGVANGGRGMGGQKRGGRGRQ